MKSLRDVSDGRRRRPSRADAARTSSESDAGSGTAETDASEPPLATAPLEKGALWAL